MRGKANRIYLYPGHTHTRWSSDVHFDLLFRLRQNRCNIHLGKTNNLNWLVGIFVIVIVVFFVNDDGGLPRATLCAFRVKLVPGSLDLGAE